MSPFLKTPNDAYPLLILRQAMAGVVTISVDGQDGELVARNNGFNAASLNRDLALVKVNCSPIIDMSSGKVRLLNSGGNAYCLPHTRCTLRK